MAAAGPLVDLDIRAGRSLSRPGGLSSVAELGADLGNMQVALCVLGAATAWAGWRGMRTGVRGWWLPPLTAALAMAAVPALVVPLKVWIGRPGPWGPVEGYGWYPSGHAATATIAYGMAALLLAATLHRPAARRLLAAVAVLLNLAVGAGLVHRGYHWPLDVLGSWLLFGALLCAVSGLLPFGRLGAASRLDAVSRPSAGRAARPPRASPAPGPRNR
ncbi:phosphatase PAP2 family protein [Streptomyces sp. KR80]|uniref:phosphatase PAP2 family protein n=1 Tax=Streptomyces sp. KR80 TaxID=3457426 RepID=UPI003FD2784A